MADPTRVWLEGIVPGTRREGAMIDALRAVLDWCDERDLPGAKVLDFDEETERVRYALALADPIHHHADLEQASDVTLDKIRDLHKVFGHTAIRTPGNRADQAFFLAVGEILQGGDENEESRQKASG